MICQATPKTRIRIQDPFRLFHQGKQRKSNPSLRITQFSFQLSLSAQGRRRKMAIEQTMLTSGASGRVNALLSLRVLKSLLMLVNVFVLLLVMPFRGRKRSVSVNSGGKDERQESGVCCQRKGPVVRVPTKIVPWKSSSTAASVAVDQEVAVRRALAIQRVMLDADVDNGSVREFSLFDTPRGETIFTQSWNPVSIKIRGVVVILHGLNEHSGRYSDFAKQLNANGYKVYAMDWIGHGGSDGLHAFVPSLDNAVSDLKSYLWKVLSQNQRLPCFCFGHSTGGAIILKAALDPKVETSIAGIVLTSPAVGVQPSHPILAVLAPLFSLLLPKYQLSAANKKGTLVSRDPEALIAKYSDPLVYTGSIRIRTGCEILRIGSYLQQNMNRLKVPFLVLHGTSDTVTDPEASMRLYKEAASTDKDIKLFEGLLHDLLFEPEREEVTETILEWLHCRV